MAKDDKAAVVVSAAPQQHTEPSKPDPSDEELERLTAPQVVVHSPGKDPGRMVKIRPRKTLGRTFIGGTPYQINENKEMFVPKHVADLLMEKGVT